MVFVFFCMTYFTLLVYCLSFPLECKFHKGRDFIIPSTVFPGSRTVPGSLLLPQVSFAGSLQCVSLSPSEVVINS